MRFRDLIVYALPPFVWGGIIYWFSSQPYQKQNIRPFLGEYDLSWAERWFSWVSFTYSKSVISIEVKGVESFVEFFVRKGAHLFVFFVLGWLIFRLLKLLSQKLIWQIFTTISIVILFAIIDEYRHLLHPNRSGLIEDVILDTIGGLFGIFFGVIMQTFVGKRYKSNREKIPTN